MEKKKKENAPQLPLQVHPARVMRVWSVPPLLAFVQHIDLQTRLQGYSVSLLFYFFIVLIQYCTYYFLLRVTSVTFFTQH